MPDLPKSRTKRYATVIIRSLTTAVLVFVLAMVAGIYVTNHVLKKIYSATAVMDIQPQAVNSPETTGWAFSTPQSRAVEAEFETIESPEVLQAIVTDLGLDREWAERLFNRSDALPAQDAIRHLKSNLRITFKHGTNIVDVRATSDDPQEAANIANALVNSYASVRDRQADGAGRPVQILARATVPDEPSRPNRRLCYAITAGLAGMLSVLVASAMEVCLLIARAEEAASGLEPAR